MKKLSLLLGTLGGAMAGYLFSNTKLREELSSAKDAETAGKILAKHLQHDGKQIGNEVKKFVESEEVKDNLKKAKAYVKDNARKLQGDLKTMIGKGASHTRKIVSATTKKAAAPAKRAVKKSKK